MGELISPAEFLKRLDERAMPRYTTGQVARYLHVPESTIRAWFYGTVYGRHLHTRRFEPIIPPIGSPVDAPADPQLLSFYDIASAHILCAFKKGGVGGDHLRDIVNSLREEYPGSPYPLLEKEFYRFGQDVVHRAAGEMLNLGKPHKKGRRQLVFEKIVQRFLSRVDVDSEKMPFRFAPVFGSGRGRAWIVIDPNYGGGRPVVEGTGIPAEVIARRSQGGESVAALARDYRLSPRAIQEAVTYIQHKAA